MSLQGSTRAASPGEPIELTLIQWRNREIRFDDGKPPRHTKVIAHSGPFTQYTYGSKTPANLKARHGHRPPDADYRYYDDEAQGGLAHSALTGTMVVDVDSRAEFEAGPLAAFTSRDDRWLERSDDPGNHFHILLDARGIPAEDWPSQGPVDVSNHIKCNGFTPLPGSVHYSGSTYRRVADEDGTYQIVTVTPEMNAAIKAARAQADGQLCEIRGARSGSGAGSGGGHDGEMAAYCLSLRWKGRSRDEIYDLWRQKADAEQDESWPFTRADFSRHMSNVPARAGARQEQAGSSGDGQPVNLLARMKRGGYLNTATFAPLHYHVPGLVPEGLTVLAGAPKVGKSWLVLLWLLRLALEGTPALYLALEDSDRRMQWRCRTLLGEGTEIPAQFCYMTEADIVPGTLLPTVAQFVAENAAGKPLIAVDTLAKASQQTPRIAGEAAYERDYRVTSELQGTVKNCPGAGGVLNHHDRKAYGDDWMDKISGTKGITGGPDTILLLERPRNEEDGALHVSGRDVAENDYAMSLAQDTFRWELAGGTLATAAAEYHVRKSQGGLGGRSADLVALAHQRGPEGLRAAEAASATGMTPNAAAEYLTRLSKKNRLLQEGRGLYKCVCCVCSNCSPAVSITANTHNTHTQRTHTTHTERGESQDHSWLLDDPVDLPWCDEEGS